MLGQELARRPGLVALDDELRLAVRSAVPGDADDDEVGMHLRETARLADGHERLVREQELF